MSEKEENKVNDVKEANSDNGKSKEKNVSEKDVNFSYEACKAKSPIEDLHGGITKKAKED